MAKPGIMEQTIDNLSPEARDTYMSARKSMYLILARMHDMGMNPDIDKVQSFEFVGVNTFMLGQVIIGNDQKLKEKNPLENISAIEAAFRTAMDKLPLSKEILEFMTNESQLAFLLFLCGGAQVWFERNCD